MATIQIKRNNSNAATKPSSLLVGELAGNLLDRSLFSSDGSNVFQFYTGTTKWFDASGNANNANKLGGTAASSYATQAWVEGKKYLTGIPSEYVTETELNNTLGGYQTKITSSNKLAYSLISGTPTLATVATSGKYSDLSGVPSSLPASDVYAWAKKATLAVGDVPDLSSKYAAVGLAGSSSYVALKNGGYITYSGGDKWRVTNSDWTAAYGILHENNYSSYALPLSGGKRTITSTDNTSLVLKTDGYHSLIQLDNNHGNSVSFGYYSGRGAEMQNGSNYLAIKDDGTPVYNTNTLIHSGNIGSYNAGSATKLQTARTIWGQSFDGTGNVDGKIYQEGKWIIGLHPDNNLYIGYDSKSLGNTLLFGNEIQTYNSIGSVTAIIKNNGNVLIGITTDSGYKLYVNGTSKVRDKAAFGHTILADRYNGQGNTAGAALIVNKGGDYFGVGASSSNISNISFGWVNDLEGTWKKELVTINASNNIILNQGVYISATDSASTARGVLELATSQNRFIIGYGIANAGYDTSLQGNNIEFTYGTSHTVGMKLTSGGNVLIGTTTDSGDKLRINGGVRAAGHIRLDRYHGASEYLQLEAEDVNINYRAYDTDGWCSHNFFSNDYKLVMFNGYAKSVEINGNLTATGDGVFGSDARYKSKIQDLAVDIETIANAPVFSYKWTDREDDKVHLGTTAQYWLDTNFKDAVDTSNKDFYHLNYGALGVAIGVSLAKKTVDHEERIKALEKENKELKNELKQLKQWHN